MPNTPVPAAATGLPIARRVFLRQLVAASALTVPVAAAAMAHATAGEPDPIFPAIDRHRRLEAAFDDVCRLTDEVAAKQDGREITPSDEELYDHASERADSALAALVGTVPVTVAGVRAMLTYVFSLDSLEDETRDACLASLLRSPALAGGAHV
jgi:hypothetical protein